MPHIILEHNLEDPEKTTYVCKKLHGALAKQDTIKLESIKTRSIRVEDLILGDGQKKSKFAHVTVKLLPGRSDDLKNTMSLALLDILKSTLEKGSFSVEFLELGNYSK